MASNRRFRFTLVLLALAVLAPSLVGAVSAAPIRPKERCDKQCQDDLRRARDATEKYWQVSTARESGFVESPSNCVSSDAGTLGIQYTYLARASDQTVEVTEPEALLYIPEALGTGRRLVGLEYSVPVEDGKPRPELFGRTFGGPEEARTLGFEQYVLRAWLYSDNPAGLFAPANPGEACDAAGLIDWHVQVEKCLEVFGTFPVDEDRLRKEGNIPESFDLRIDSEGKASINIDTNGCERLFGRDRHTGEPLLWVNDLLSARFSAILGPHNWEGGDFGLNRYLLRYFFDDREIAKRARQWLGVGADVVPNTDEVEREFNPVSGTMTDAAYRFETPDFVLTATVIESPPTSVDAALRYWHETQRGSAKLHPYAHVTALGPAYVEVTPKRGSLLATLLCEEPGPCGPIPAKTGVALTFDAALRLTAQ